jgi:hypothetical protein
MQAVGGKRRATKNTAVRKVAKPTGKTSTPREKR